MSKKSSILHVIAVIFVFCLIFIFYVSGKTVQLRSDGTKIEFLTEGENITCISIKGKSPYGSVCCSKTC